MRYKMTITILTPVYNRKEGVEALWKTLQNQTEKDFEWLVVDDGSTDNTEGLIKQLQTESDFSIRYIYKENGGKHTALNVGIKSIKSELIFIVDSDDFVTEDAVDSILKFHKKYRNHSDICGYAFLMGRLTGKSLYLMK